MSTPDRDYQRMIAALADLTRRHEHDLATAERAYRDSAARAAGELTRADRDAAAADRRAGAAAAQVLDVDTEAARLWEQLRRARGVRLRTLGDLPEPAPVEARPEARTDTPRALLARATERIDDTVRPPARRPLPRWVLPFLPVLGAVVAGGTGLLAAGLVTVGGAVGDSGTGGAVIRGLGWLAFVMAPSAGVPLAAALAHRRLQARLDIGGIGLTLLGGMVAATMMSLTFAASH